MFKTKTMQNAGKLPKWNETFGIDVRYIGDDMHLSVMDEDLTKADLVGETNIKLSSLCINGGLDDWFEIQFKGKKAGSVHLRGEWRPTGPTQ
jgi:Ca2+-dependent lipid-binding protein